MQKQIRLVLGDHEVGQLIDGLEIREQAWRNTVVYLETGESPEEFFLAEECSDADEARNVANAYQTIIAKIHKQLAFQRSLVTSEDILAAPQERVTNGYAIYIDTLCQGPVAVERGEANKPIAYATERAAQCEIVESTIIRLQQFLAGERDFDDVTTIKEYIVPVDLHPDGSITDENGNTFPNDSW